jgi:hypothetical protein
MRRTDCSGSGVLLCGRVDVSAEIAREHIDHERARGRTPKEILGAIGEIADPFERPTYNGAALAYAEHWILLRAALERTRLLRVHKTGGADQAAAFLRAAKAAGQA